jgi:hypothetical protein
MISGGWVPAAAARRNDLFFEDDGDRQHHRVKIHFLLAPAGPKRLKAP